MADWEEAFEGLEEVFESAYKELAWEEWVRWQEKLALGRERESALTYIALSSYMEAQQLGFEENYIRWKRVIRSFGEEANT